MAKPVHKAKFPPRTDDRRFGADPINSGRLVMSRGIETVYDVKEFMFNPTTVNVKHGWDWGSHRVPGMHVPMLSGGSGKERTIEFTLRLDGDRGRLWTRRGAPVGGSPECALDIGDELAWYESLTYPEDPPDGASVISQTTPPVLILTLGSFFSRVVCVCDDVDINILAFTPTMEPKLADVRLKLMAWDRRVKYVSDAAAVAVFDNDGGRNG